jgi:hypothetical protein
LIDLAPYHQRYGERLQFAFLQITPNDTVARVHHNDPRNKSQNPNLIGEYVGNSSRILQGIFERRDVQDIKMNNVMFAFRGSEVDFVVTVVPVGANHVLVVYVDKEERSVDTTAPPTAPQSFRREHEPPEGLPPLGGTMRDNDPTQYNEQKGA